MKTLLIGLVRSYRAVLSPVKNALGLGGCCRFYPTCSAYALEALRTYGAWRGSKLALKRLLKCHPWGPSGYDPVPLPKQWDRAIEESGVQLLEKPSETETAPAPESAQTDSSTRQ